MILYHFTKAENLKGIAERGLVPDIGKTTDLGALTFGIPVVWFTSNSLPLWLVGLGCGSAMCMLTVDINRKRLHHWRSWLAKLQGVGINENGKPRHFVGIEVLDAMSRDKESEAKRLTDTSNYWICTGIVHPMHIVECQHFEYRDTKSKIHTRL